MEKITSRNLNISPVQRGKSSLGDLNNNIIDIKLFSIIMVSFSGVAVLTIMKKA
jgi:hypothetical protein